MKNLENLTVNDYFDVIRRRIVYVIVTAILVSIGAVAVVLRLPSIYKSETTILFSSRLLPEDYIRSIDRQTATDQMDFVRQQLQSRTFLDQIVSEFRLATDNTPEGIESASNRVRGNTEITVLTTTTFKIGFYAPDPRLAQAITRRQAEKVIQLNGSFRREKVQVADQFLEDELRKASDELSLAEQKLFQYRSQSSPGLASEVVTVDSLRDLQGQLAKLQTSADDATNLRKSLQRRMEEHRQLQLVMKATAPPRPEPVTAPAPAPVAPPPPPPSPLEEHLASKRAELAAASTRFTALHPEVVRLTLEVADLEAQVKQAAAARPKVVAPPPPPPPAPKEIPVLPELNSADFLEAEIRQEMEQAELDITKAEQAKQALLAKIGSYQERLNPSPANAEQLGSLTRMYDTAKQRYNYLSDKKLTAEMAARVDTSENNETFKIIDAAYLPLRPVKPDRRLLAALGSLGGLVLGLGIAFLRDYAASALHNEDEVANELKIPVLASIPSVTKVSVNKGSSRSYVNLRLQRSQQHPGEFSFRDVDVRIRDVLLNPHSVAGEPYRLLHSALATIQRQRPMKRLLISSAVPGEGKTFTACCLSGTLAHEPGKKVLLIDADLRRSKATSTLGLGERKFEHTFGALLRGEADIENSAIRFEDSNLWFLPSGSMMANPLEVLTSPQLEPALNRFSELFDWIIIDSPPIMAVADANLIAPLCDRMLLVVHSGKTPVKLIKDSLQRVGRDRVCGVVMNRTKAVQSSYYHGYGGYYQAPVQAPTVLSRLKRRDAE